MENVTVDAWVKPVAMPSNNSLIAIVTKWNSNPSQNSSSSDAYGLFLINNNGTLQAFAEINRFTGNEIPLQGGTVPLNTFTHVAMTYDGGTLALFELRPAGESAAR